MFRSNKSCERSLRWRRKSTDSALLKRRQFGGRSSKRRSSYECNASLRRRPLGSPYLFYCFSHFSP